MRIDAVARDFANPRIVNSNPQIIIVADDLTGAADTGAGLAREGFVTLIALSADNAPSADVLVLTTESRHIPEAQAVARVLAESGRLAPYAAKDGTWWFYKKIDSTLRGHPGVELAAMMEGLGLERALVAPAYPAQGRTTTGGVQEVDGEPIERTHFGAEVSSSDLVRLFDVGDRPVRLIDLATVRRGPEVVRDLLNAGEPAVFVADAQMDDDLLALAQAAEGSAVRVLCGSAGLMAALAGVATWRPEASPPDVPPLSHGPVLVVAGSRQPRTVKQVAVAEKQGAAVLQPDKTLFEDAFSADDSFVERVADKLVRGCDVIITTIGLDGLDMEGREVATRLARCAQVVLDKVSVGSLVLTGGDIAAAVCSSLNVDAVWLCGEVQAGVPHGRLLGGRFPGLPVVTKAGGFGDDDALRQSVQYHKGTPAD